jgi:transcriptional regulator with XRE-family HTH domain
MTVIDIASGWIPDPAQDFGQRLALVRQHQAWNIREAARACGIDPESWRNWEQTGRRPRAYDQACLKIADASGCNVAWLMTGGIPQQRGGSATRQYQSLAQVLPFRSRMAVAA